MKKNQLTSIDSAGLRSRAEERLREKQKTRRQEASGQKTRDDAQRLVHELQVHQIELQLQNEELLRARSELEAALERYTDLYDFAPIGYFALDHDGTIQQVNLTGARLLGRERSRLESGCFGLFVSEADRPAFNAFLERAFTSKARESCEVSLQKKKEDLTLSKPSSSQGTLMANPAFVVRIEGMASEDGTECRVVVEDISERRKMEEARERLAKRLQQAQKHEGLGVLAGGIAHDFNNLLMGILGNADLTLLDLPPNSPQRKYLTTIKTITERLSEIVKQILDYSGKGGSVAEPLNLSEMVTEMVSLLEVSFSKKIMFKFDQAPDLPTIKADSTKLRQVVLSLITNATEAIGDKSGLVSIRTGVMKVDQEYLSQLKWHQEIPEGLYAYLEVSDTGCGMSEEVQEKIFEPFFTTKFTGRGMGLSAVMGIVYSHKGAIQVHSQPGKGATFRILFPGAAHVVPVATKQPVAEPIRYDKGQTILVVDDEESVRTATAMLLMKGGLSVLTAEDGEKALKLLSKHSQDIDVVLLDLSMPKMDGIETFNKIREIYAHLPVILSSGYNEQEATQSFAGKGLSGFIQKPYNIEALFNKFAQILYR
jgi:signal transduction histidine kinase